MDVKWQLKDLIVWFFFFVFFWRSRLVSPGVYYHLSNAIIPCFCGGLDRSKWLSESLLRKRRGGPVAMLARRLPVATGQTLLLGF